MKRVSRKVASAMTATYTKERELPAARSTLEPVNVQVLLHHRDGVESAPPPRARGVPKSLSHHRKNGGGGGEKGGGAGGPGWGGGGAFGGGGGGWLWWGGAETVAGNRQKRLPNALRTPRW